VFAADVNIVERKLLTLKKNTEAILVSCKDNGIQLNAVKITFVVMSGDQNSRRSHNVKCDNVSFERVKEVKLFGTVLKYENSVQQDIKSRMKSGKVFYLAEQKFCLPGFLCENI
jgi:hypothetical protein